MYCKEKYIEDRLTPRIDWYGKKSATLKKIYIVLNIIIITASSLIPVIAILSEIDEFIGKVIIALLGAISAILTGVLNIFKAKEYWITYRQVAETLKRERVLYNSRSGVYKCDEAIDLLITRCEEIMSNENNTWGNSYIPSK